MIINYYPEYCRHRLNLTKSEFTYVTETPEMHIWADDVTQYLHEKEQCKKPGEHWHECLKNTDPLEVQCELSTGHDGEHCAIVGHADDGTVELDMYIVWQTGIPGARKIIQPGPACSSFIGDSQTGDNCLLFEGHPGLHCFGESGFSENGNSEE